MRKDGVARVRRDFLEEGDSEILDFLYREYAILKATLGKEGFESFAADVRHYDFEKALLLLESRTAKR